MYCPQSSNFLSNKFSFVLHKVQHCGPLLIDTFINKIKSFTESWKLNYSFINSSISLFCFAQCPLYYLFQFQTNNHSITNHKAKYSWHSCLNEIDLVCIWRSWQEAIIATEFKAAIRCYFLDFTIYVILNKTTNY